MRIVFLNPAGVIGGAERVLLSAVRAVREYMPDSEPTVVLLADGPLRDAVVAAGAEVVVAPLPPALAAVGDTQFRGEGRASKVFGLGRILTSTALPALDFLRRLRSQLRGLAPDLIHSNGLKAHLVARFCRPPRVPVTWHLHDFYSERPVMARLLKRVREGVVGGVAISDSVRRDFDSVVPDIPARVVLNGVDTDHFNPAARGGEPLDRLAGLPPCPRGVVRVGLVATYANWKGQGAFLDALARLPPSGPPIRGYVIGGPIYATAGSQYSRPELEERAKRNGLTGRVGFLPFQSDPADMYRMLDVVVHASTRPEPFGLTIAEAMSCGRAVVVSAAGGASELFTDGLDAVGYPPGDVTALVEKIGQLASDAGFRARLGSAARITALQRFGLDRFGREITDFFGWAANQIRQ